MGNILAMDLNHEAGYQFTARFGGTVPDLLMDEPEPMGQGKGPSPDQLLGAAVANCLSASLIFALRKFKHEPFDFRTQAEVIQGRNQEGRLRIVQINVFIKLSEPASNFIHLDKALAQFENFCTVTESIRQCVPVKVTVQDGDGAVLK